MTARELTLTALALLAGAGSIYVLDDKGQPQQVTMVADASGKTEIAPADAAAVLVDDAGRSRALVDGSTVTCRAGGYLDGVYRSDKEWCSDGNGATWVRDAKGEEVLTVAAGKVYSTKVSVAAAQDLEAAAEVKP